MARLTKFRRTRRGRRALLLAGALLAVAALQVGSSSARVTTDQAEYAPGATVTISGDNSDGAGYVPGEAVRVEVSGPNGYAASCDATADETGAWSCQVTLVSSELAVGTYTYTATGAQSGVTESGTFSDAIDTFQQAAHTQVRHWYSRGQTVYALGTFATATLSYTFSVIDPTGAAVQTTSCLVRSGANAGDSYLLPAAAALSATASWSYSWTEWAGAGCTGLNRTQSQPFRVAQLYAFTNATDRNNCGGASPGAAWPASCANAVTTFSPAQTAFVRVLGLDPGVANVSTTWNKPSGPACANTTAGDRPDGNATDGRLDTSYPLPVGEIPDVAANCGPMTQTGAWTIDLADGANGVRALSLPAFSVQQLRATVSTTIHEVGHHAVTTVPVGTNVHDFVSVSGGTGNPVPTGNVTVDWFLNGTCEGLPNSSSAPATLDSAGTVDVTAFNFTPTTAGDRAFRAHYAGDTVYARADGPCETLHVVDANIQITPATDANPVGTNHVLTITVNALNGTLDAGMYQAAAFISGVGSFVVGPTCIYIGGGTSASCTVTITSATTGTSTISATSNIRVSGGTITRTTNTPENTNAGGSGDATKHWADDTVTTVVRDSAGNDVGTTTLGGATVVHDEATVRRTPGTPAPVADPTGTVDFTLYDNGTCDGHVIATDPGKPLNASGTATSATFTIPAVVGTYSYKAHYNGDVNYPAHDGPCEPFNFDGVPPVTTIVLDPANPDSCCWYVFAVKPTVSATDVGTGVLETRCVLDPATPPTSFADLPPGMCPYLAPSSWVVTDGIHTLYAGSIDKATPGNTDLVQVTFKIDRTPPTSQVDPLPQFQPSPGAFTVSWSGMDNLSGIKDFDVRYRTAPAGGSFGAYTQWFTDTTLTSALFTPTPGSTVCFSVRARDRACWEQPTYSPEVCTTAPYDDPSLTRTGSWSTVTGSGYFGPGVSRSTTYNNKLTLTGLRASVIGVLVTKQPGGGPIELRWNGSTKLSTNLTAASVQKKQLLTFTLPSVQTGTLEIVQTGYGTVDIDAAGAYKAS